MSRFPPLSFLLGLLLPSIAAAQGVDTNRWVPNGPVYAVQQFGSTTFIGGEFTMLSPPTGAAVSIQTANEFPATGYPKVVGRVYAVIPDQSGGWILGGIFSSVGGQPRNNIARVNSDYSVNAWNPNANGPVYALQLSFVGTVYAGGDFTSIGGQSRSRLAELDLGAGNATTSMTIGVNGPVRAFTWNNNSVYAVGDFTTAAGIAQNRGCSINVNTRGLSGWNPNTNGPVFAIRTITRPGPVTTILIGGQFTTVGGQPRNFLAETNAGGGAVAAWNPSPNHWVRAIETRLGVAYVGGEFTTIAGAARNHAAAIDVNGLATSWNPNVDGPVHAILNNAANVAVGGTFENIGGQPFTNLARIDATTGVPAAWNPKPNGTVRSIVDNTSTIYVGGDFSGVGGVVRKRLAAYDDITGSVAPWNPGADSTVWALGVRKYGPVLYTVYAGGIFSHVGGFTRAGVAAIHPKTGVPTAWTVPTALFVQSIATTDSEVVLGGTLDGAGTRMAAVPHAGGAMTAFTPAPSGGPPMALAVKGDTVYVGHSIGIARYSLASHTRISEAAPYLGSVPIRALCVKGDFIYVGGEFTMVNAVQFRPYLIRIRGNGQVDGWNPNVDGIVRAITAGETGMLIGGDFKNAGGAPRAGVAQLDETTGIAQAWTANAVDYEIDALSSSGPHVRIGGRFRGIGTAPQANLAAVGPPRIDSCFGPPPGTEVGPNPHALVALDLNLDATPDLAVCDGLVPEGHVLRGQGSGNYADVQTIATSAIPQAIVAADFDLDGREDLAVSESGDTGTIGLYRNVAGTFQPWASVPLPGRSEGLVVGDYDADGILDFAVCLLDSSSVIRHGGLQLVKGGGTNGVWNGTFTLSTKTTGLARRVVAQDLDGDGWMDFVCTGSQPGAVTEVRLGPGMAVKCAVTGSVDAPLEDSGVALATGDFNGDGRPDLASTVGRALRIRLRNASNGCGDWFGSPSDLALPSTPRDLEVMDIDADGIADIVCAFDSLASLALCQGAGDGTFAAPVTIDSHDVYDVAPVDAYVDGATDIIGSRSNCGMIGLAWGNPHGVGDVSIHLDAPNGGETWSLGAQTISWTPAGVGAVDVELSRDGGQTWRPIATHVAGSSMTWNVSPPGTTNARMRVRDAVYRTVVDASDAPFTILDGVVAAPAAALKAGLRLVGRNPARGSVAFVLDVPVSADASVALYDAAGRRVRVLANGPYRPGSYDLAWDGRNDGGAGCRSGVYFVKARIGTVETRRKVVLL